MTLFILLPLLLRQKEYANKIVGDHRSALKIWRRILSRRYIISRIIDLYKHPLLILYLMKKYNKQVPAILGEGRRYLIWWKTIWPSHTQTD